MMDEALLRPGRLEVQIEIGLPNEKGRSQILKVMMMMMIMMVMIMMMIMMVMMVMIMMIMTKTNYE